MDAEVLRRCFTCLLAGRFPANLISVLFSLWPERIMQTVEITKHMVDIEEKGVKLRLTIVDTPGFGDAVDNTEWYVFPLERGVELALAA